MLSGQPSTLQIIIFWWVKFQDGNDVKPSTPENFVQRALKEEENSQPWSIHIILWGQA